MIFIEFTGFIYHYQPSIGACQAMVKLFPWDHLSSFKPSLWVSNVLDYHVTAMHNSTMALLLLLSSYCYTPFLKAISGSALMHVEARNAGPFSELDEVNRDIFLHILLSPGPFHDRVATVKKCL
jgi:hypothetical protein